MNQLPDKLFRDKLQSYQTPAPSGAWNRIEANLNKKNDNVLWFRIAAGFLLVAIATYLLWPANSATTVTPKSELAAKTKKHETVSPEQQKEEKRITPSTVPGSFSANKSQRKRVVKKPTQTITVEEAAVTHKEEVTVANTASVEAARDAVVAIAEKQKLKIIFAAEDIDTKYLDKKALAEATSDAKKSSTLKKLLDKAYDLKYNQDPFGDLRQKKNEILALNFRKKNNVSEN